MKRRILRILAILLFTTSLLASSSTQKTQEQSMSEQEVPRYEEALVKLRQRIFEYETAIGDNYPRILGRLKNLSKLLEKTEENITDLVSRRIFQKEIIKLNKVNWKPQSYALI